MSLLDPILKALDEFKITDKFLRAAILANIEKECGLKPQEENLNYSKTSNERIRKIFSSRVLNIPDSELNNIKRKPEEFAEIIYGYKTKIGRNMGNLNPGDGWSYRGRGYIQITGRNNYQRIGDAIGVNLIQNPNLLVSDPDISAKAALSFILAGTSKRSFDTLADACRCITQVIGGNGLNLSVGYGAELLSKVNALALKYIK